MDDLEECVVKHCSVAPTLAMTINLYGVVLVFDLCEPHFDVLNHVLNQQKD